MDQELMKQLTVYAAEEGLPENSSELELSRKQIQTLAKGYIARDLWSTSEFYQIINEDDDKFQAALSIIKDWDLYEVSLLAGKEKTTP
jgi:carboxyl-terminal processing protease